VNLGDYVKDTITDFEGTVISRHEYLNGCVRLSLQPRELREGKLVEALTFDVEQLVLVKAAEPKLAIPKGGPQHEPPRQAVPAR
jgi:hypothetical protein